MNCGNCGTSNADENVYCISCGQSLTGGGAGHPQVQSSGPTAKISRTEGNIISLSIDMDKVKAMNIWGPFAGYGTRKVHNGWLVSGKGNKANELVENIRSSYSDREIPGALMAKKTMIAKGLLVETRPYFILNRGAINIALYISEFGKDLFVSLASYLKPPFSNFRILVVAFLALIGWISPNFVFPILANLGSSIFNSNTSAVIVLLLCILTPFILISNLAINIFVIGSIYKWFTEKDFWAWLRTAPNEFNQDDLMAMEKAVEQTVRFSLDQIGISPDELKPIMRENRRRLI